MEVSEDNNIIHSMSLACKQVLWSRKGRVKEIRATDHALVNACYTRRPCWKKVMFWPTVTQHKLLLGQCLFPQPFIERTSAPQDNRIFTQYMNRFYLINHHNRFIQKYITNVESFMNLVNLINKSLTNEITTKPWWWFTISDLNEKTFCRILTNRLLSLIAKTTNTR